MHRANDLARQRPLPIEDLASAIIATPNDLRCGYPVLRSSLEATGIDAKFVDVESTPEAHYEFLKSGGIVVSFGNTPLLSRYADLASATLVSRNRKLTWPLFFVYAETDKKPSPLPLLAQYLRDLPKKIKDIHHLA